MSTLTGKPILDIPKIYEKFQTGDRLSDEELEVGIEHFENLWKRTAVSGPLFQLAANEAMRVWNALVGYKRSREGNTAYAVVEHAGTDREVVICKGSRAMCEGFMESAYANDQERDELGVDLMKNGSTEF